MMEKKYLILAFYIISTIEDPQKTIKQFKRFFEVHDALGRIYVNEQGINAQMSIAEKDAQAFYDFFLSDERFKNADIKVHTYREHVFPKKTVKYRKQLVALDRPVDFSKEGTRIPSKKWKEMLEKKDENTLLLDVRNDYEWEVGHFDGAIKPECKTFREFHDYIRSLQKKLDPKKTRVMMYCTGGIRCEFYSCLMKEEGFEEVYQLEGGVIKYGTEEGSKHWKGKLFVFDDRLTVPISEKEESETIGTCHHCKKNTDTFINCANMICNHLFLCCSSCAKEFEGCCSNECKTAPYCREFDPKKKPKPFRKLPFEIKEKLRKQFG